MKWQESETVRSLLKKQNSLLGDSLEEMASQIFQHKGKDFSLTVSCGIAEFDSNLIKSPVDLVKVADEALYKAKHEGRNRTIVGTP